MAHSREQILMKILATEAEVLVRSGLLAIKMAMACGCDQKCTFVIVITQEFDQVEVFSPTQNNFGYFGHTPCRQMYMSDRNIAFTTATNHWVKKSIIFSCNFQQIDWNISTLFAKLSPKISYKKTKPLYHVYINSFCHNQPQLQLTLFQKLHCQI